jgi:hypothetical protein
MPDFLGAGPAATETVVRQLMEAAAAPGAAEPVEPVPVRESAAGPAAEVLDGLLTARACEPAVPASASRPTERELQETPTDEPAQPIEADRGVIDSLLSDSKESGP